MSPSDARSRGSEATLHQTLHDMKELPRAASQVYTDPLPHPPGLPVK